MGLEASADTDVDWGLMSTDVLFLRDNGFQVLDFLLFPHCFHLAPGEQILLINLCETVVHCPAGFGSSPLFLSANILIRV